MVSALTLAAPRPEVADTSLPGFRSAVDAGFPTGLAWSEAAGGGGVPIGQSCAPGFSLVGFDDEGERLCRAGEVRRFYSTFLPSPVEGVAVAVGTDGRPVLVFCAEVFANSFNLFFGRCTVLSCSSLARTDLRGGGATRADVTVGTDQLAVVAHDTAPGASVGTLHCADTTCS